MASAGYPGLMQSRKERRERLFSVGARDIGSQHSYFLSSISAPFARKRFSQLFTIAPLMPSFSV